MLPTNIRDLVGCEIRFKLDWSILEGHVCGSIDADGWKRPIAIVRITKVVRGLWPVICNDDELFQVPYSMILEKV